MIGFYLHQVSEAKIKDFSSLQLQNSNKSSLLATVLAKPARALEIFPMLLEHVLILSKLVVSKGEAITWFEPSPTFLVILD